MTIAQNQIAVPLNRLVLWDGNVRKTGVETGLDELAASIAAHGLLNPLLVRKAPKGKYAVIAGQRRFLALQRLARAGTLGKDAPVSCQLPAANRDDAELSLAENVVRVAMHPADQLDAWRGLIESGASVPDIAARFGVAESTVRKRLALARVSPAILAGYRDGDLPLEALQAFTITDDHALQERVWRELPERRRDDAGAIREALTASEIPSDDRRVRFVGLDAYEAAGGAVRRDLFDDEGGGYAQDAALLDVLTRRKLDAVADTVRAEGWKWVEAHFVVGWEDRQMFAQSRDSEGRLPDDAQAEAETLLAEQEELYDADRDDEASEARLEAIEARLVELDALPRTWPDSFKAHAGAVVHLDRDGAVEIERGLIRKEDAASLRREKDDAPSPESARPALSASLIEDLTARKTAVLRIELARSPDIALAAVAHALASEAFYRAGSLALKLRLTNRSLEPLVKDREPCRAMLALDEERQRIFGKLPDDHADLWGWCLKALRDDLLDVLAVAAAQGVDAVNSRSDANAGGVAQGQALAVALGLDMAAWYRPTAEGYFGRIGKAAILADLETMRQIPSAPAWLKMKKADLAALAEREAAERGWLPELMR